MDQVTGDSMIQRDIGTPNITFSGTNVLLNSVNVVCCTQNNYEDILTLQNIKVEKNTDATLRKKTATEGLEIPAGKPIRFGTSALGTNNRFVIYETGGQLRIEQGDKDPVITLDNKKTSTGRLQVIKGQVIENYNIKDDLSNYPNVLGNVVRHGKSLYMYSGSGYVLIGGGSEKEVTITFRITTEDTGVVTPSFQVTQNGIENKIYPSGAGGQELTRSTTEDFVLSNVFIGADINIS